MDNSLNIILAISLILVTGSVLVILALLIQILKIFKRLLIKIELRVDNFELTQEELKLKILNFVEEIINKIRNYKVSFNKRKAGDKKDEKEN